MPTAMEQVYLDTIQRADPVRNVLTGYALRQELEERKARQAIQEQANALRAQELTKDYAKMELEHEQWQEDTRQKVLNRLWDQDKELTRTGLKELELQLKEDDLKQRWQIEGQKLQMSLLNYKLRGAELEQKVIANGQAALRPMVDRYKTAVSEANNIRGKLYPGGLTPVTLTEEQRATLRAELDAKVTEIDNLAGIIDRATLGPEGEQGGQDRRPKDQRARDARISETSYYVNRAKTAANLVVDARDINPQVAELKQKAADEVKELVNKTQSKIADIEKRYYKELETDPNAEPPIGKVEALLLSLKNKIQAKQQRNKYIKVDMSGLNSVLYGGSQ